MDPFEELSQQMSVFDLGKHNYVLMFSPLAARKFSESLSRDGEIRISEHILWGNRNSDRISDYRAQLDLFKDENLKEFSFLFLGSLFYAFVRPEYQTSLLGRTFNPVIINSKMTGTKAVVVKVSK